MNDRELLELSAKAAGLKHVDYAGIDYDGRLGIVLVDDIGRQCGEFSPLTDDGDALRLAVKLFITIDIGHRGIEALWNDVDGNTFSVTEPGVKSGGDSFISTRRAIVRAAAEIGKSMQ